MHIFVYFLYVGKFCVNIKNMGFTRRNMVNKDVFNYNDLCIEFVRILLVEHKGIELLLLYIRSLSTLILHRRFGGL
jgi:hypothetical protein